MDAQRSVLRFHERSGWPERAVETGLCFLVPWGVPENALKGELRFFRWD